MGNEIRPDYYGGKDSVYEVFKVLDAWGLDKDFYLANVVKYVARAGKKDPSKLIEDLDKARTYLNAKIQRLEQEARLAAGAQRGAAQRDRMKAELLDELCACGHTREQHNYHYNDCRLYNCKCDLFKLAPPDGHDNGVTVEPKALSVANLQERIQAAAQTSHCLKCHHAQGAHVENGCRGGTFTADGKCPCDGYTTAAAP